MTDSAIKYVGVDGCKGGWIGVGLDDGDGWEVKVCGEFADLVACFGDACVILVDIPIGLPEEAAPRACDTEARSILKERAGAVFPAPPKPFINKMMQTPEWDWKTAHGKPFLEAHAEANKWHRERFGGKGVAAQSFGIAPKIGEVDKFLRNRDVDSPTIREIHPEICFWALNEQQPMSRKKSDNEGRDERLDTLRRCAKDVNGIDVDAIFKKACDKFTKSRVADDDILDALVAAITAKLGCENGFMTLPEVPQTDSKGLSMEMVYALRNDAGAASRSEK